MTHTTLFNHESYLFITATVSLGVLIGCEYCSLALAVLLIAPGIKLLIKSLKAKPQDKSTQSYVNKCVNCE